jgi:hypothetical protein
MLHFEAHAGDFSPAAARRRALRFAGQRYRQEFFEFLDAVLRPKTPMRRAA